MKRYHKGWRALPILRAIGVLSAVGIITSLVTFAAIQSTGNALTGNTIETATASLQISKDGTNYSDSVAGYDFNGIVPGGTPQPIDNGGYLASLKNTGSTNLALSLTVPTQPTVSGVSDLSMVYVLITPLSTSGGTYPSQAIKLSDLIAGKVSLAHGTVSSKSVINFHVQVAMDADAVNGGGATISALDLSFSGIPQQ